MRGTDNLSLVVGAKLDERLFLARALAYGDSFGGISRELGESLYRNIAGIAQKLITMRMADLSDQFGLRMQTETAFTLTSLGLEYGSQGDLGRAVELLGKTRVVKFFQIGNTLAEQLLERARDLLENAVVLPPERSDTSMFPETYTDLEAEGFQIYTQAEREFLKTLLNYRSIIRSVQVTVRDTDVPRAFTQLSDIDMLDRQLACIEHRCRYVRTLPLGDMFGLEPSVSLLPDPIGHLTLGLMVNLVLYREVGFALDSEMRSDFQELVYVDGEVRESFRQQLLEWIAAYLAQQQESEAVQAYTVSYWDECLRLEGTAD